jgi:hypothetical protein
MAVRRPDQTGGTSGEQVRQDMNTIRRRLLGAITGTMALALIGAAAVADGLDAPEGRVILTIDGAIARTNGDGAAAFDLDMLRAMPAESFTTGSIWFDGKHEFTGVSLSTLLAAVGVQGGEIDAVAINDYKVIMPVPAEGDPYPIVAYLMDGAEMPVREKGPLWVIYPYDSSDDYRQETIYSRSIWQLHKLTVRD